MTSERTRLIIEPMAMFLWFQIGFNRVSFDRICGIHSSSDTTEAKCLKLGTFPELWSFFDLDIWSKVSVVHDFQINTTFYTSILLWRESIQLQISVYYITKNVVMSRHKFVLQEWIEDKVRRQKTHRYVWNKQDLDQVDTQRVDYLLGEAFTRTS